MIRMLTDDDIPFCLAIYNRYILRSACTFETEQLSLDAFCARVKSICTNYPWIVYEDEGKVVGYAYLSAFHERYAYRYTCDLSIYVDEKQKGKGIGKALMKEIIALAKEDGYQKIASLITIGNFASEHLHRQFGFQEVGEMKDVGYKFDAWIGIKFWLLDLHKDMIAGEIHNYQIK